MTKNKPIRAALLTVLLLLPALLCSAQQRYTLQGRIYDTQLEQWMTAAGIRVLNAQDSTLVKGALSGEDGRFAIEGLERQKRYLMSVTFVGYEDYIRELKPVDMSVLDVGTIRLQPSSTLLSEVQVVGQASPVIMKTDTVQFNTAAFATRPNASVEELLRKIPGMEVDDDGNISYNGESIERVELDGRDFFSNDPKMATRNLPASMLQNVQVVDKKSEQTRMTGMDDGERTKVLNLSVKEGQKKGIVVNGQGGYGTSDRFALNANANYFADQQRITLLANLNNTDGIRRGEGDATHRQVGLNYDNKLSEKLSLTAEGQYEGNTAFTHGDARQESMVGANKGNVQQQNYSNQNTSHNAQLSSRLEWTPSDRTMLLFLPDLSWQQNTVDSNNTFGTINDRGKTINKGTAHEDSREDALETNLGLHFRHTLNDAGRNLYIRLHGGYQKDSGEGSKQSATTFNLQDRTENLDQKTRSTGENISANIALSYLEPFSKSWALQLSYRLNTQDRKSSRLAYNIGADGTYSLLDEEYSRSSANTNRTHRLGAQLRYSFWHRSNIYLGFDASPTYTHTTTTNGRVTTFDKERTVWNYSPSLTLDLRPADSLQVMIRYNGRTHQPSMTQLSDVPVLNSPLSVTVGNPDLLPMYVHQVRTRMAFNRRDARQSFEIFGSASVTQSDIIGRSSVDRETGRRQNTYENVDGTSRVWLGATASTPIGGRRSKWTSFTFANLMFNKSKAYVNDELNHSNILAPRLSQRITWSGDKLQATIGGSARYQEVKNSIATQLDRRTVDYSIFNDLTWQLPYDLTLTSRISYNDAAGYNDDIKRRLVLWDLSIAWSFLEGKNATIQLSGFDVLGQRNTFSRSVTANSITDRTINGITTYALLTFSYRFTTFGAGSTPDADQGRRSRYGRPMGPPHRIH